MQVEFWDLLEIEPTWLRLFEWAQVIKLMMLITLAQVKSSKATLKISENYVSMKILLKKRTSC